MPRQLSANQAASFSTTFHANCPSHWAVMTRQLHLFMTGHSSNILLLPRSKPVSSPHYHHDLTARISTAAEDQSPPIPLGFPTLSPQFPQPLLTCHFPTLPNPALPPPSDIHPLHPPTLIAASLSTKTCHPLPRCSTRAHHRSPRPSHPSPISPSPHRKRHATISKRPRQPHPCCGDLLVSGIALKMISRSNPCYRVTTPCANISKTPMLPTWKSYPCSPSPIPFA